MGVHGILKSSAAIVTDQVKKNPWRQQQKSPLQGLICAGGNGGIRTLDEALHPILP